MSIIRLSVNIELIKKNLFSVNLAGVERVDMTHFDLLKVLGTGGKSIRFIFIDFFFKTAIWQKSKGK